MNDVTLKRFETPDETRIFPKGKFELIRIGAMTIGRATYEPGWKWSIDVGAALGQTSCQVEHTGMVVSGSATAAMDDGTIHTMTAGDLFYIAPGHDSWSWAASLTSPSTSKEPKLTPAQSSNRPPNHLD
jgi:hypothetical protein